jgi:hypothetical protein
MKKTFNGILFLVVVFTINCNYAQEAIDPKIIDDSCNCIKKLA